MRPRDVHAGWRALEAGARSAPARSSRRVAAGVIALLVSFAPAARAATMWMNPANACFANCGLTATTGCPGWFCLMSQGCASGSPGCWDNINNGSAAADRVNMLPGQYVGDGNGQGFCIGANRPSVHSTLTIECTDANGNPAWGACAIDGVGTAVTEPGQRGLVTIGAYPCGADSVTDYVRLVGVQVTNPRPGQSGVKIRTASNISVRESTVNCNGINTDCVQAAFGSRVTFANDVVSPCGDGAYGCLNSDGTSNVAFVGTDAGPRYSGPHRYPANTDGLTVQNGRRVLIHAARTRGYTNGIDAGMHTSSPPLSGVIVRYSVVSDAGNIRGACGCGNGTNNETPCTSDAQCTGGGKCGCDWTSQGLKFSGCEPQGGCNPAVAATDISIYKNLNFYTSSANRNGCLWITESMGDTTVAYNTCIDVDHDPGDGTRASLIVNATGVSPGNTPVLWNVIDSTSSIGCSPGQACQNTVGGACTSGACRWVGNRFWFSNYAPSTGFLDYAPSDLARAYFAIDTSRIGGGLGLNATGANAGNLRADPRWANASGTRHEVADFKLTAASVNNIDQGGAFCTTTSSGTGTVIPVTCGGALNDPRHYFPQPADYFDLQNADGAGRGVLAVEANGNQIGVYDVKIEGCVGGGGLGNLPGVRSAVSLCAGGTNAGGECLTDSECPGGACTASGMTSSSLRVRPACNYAAGAMVHVVYDGAKPDINFAEYASAPAPTGTAPTPTATPTATATRSPTPTITATKTPTLTATPAPTNTSSPAPRPWDGGGVVGGGQG